MQKTRAKLDFMHFQRSQAIHKNYATYYLHAVEKGRVFHHHSSVTNVQTWSSHLHAFHQQSLSWRESLESTDSLLFNSVTSIWTEEQITSKTTSISQHTISPTHSIHCWSQRKCLILILHRLLHKPWAHHNIHNIHTYEKYLQKFSRKHHAQELGHKLGFMHFQRSQEIIAKTIYLHTF